MARISIPLLAFVFFCSIALVQSASVKKLKKDRTLPNRAFRKASNPTDAFCQKFVAQCYKSALEGKTGNVQVIQACRRNGKKFSSSFSFGCRADGNDITQDVLNRIGGGLTVTSNVGPVVTVSGTVTTVQTSAVSTILTNGTTTLTSSNVVGTVSSVNVNTALNLQTSIITTAVPVTLTSVSTQIISSTIPVVSTVATSVITTVILGVDPVPVIQVVLGPVTVAKRLNRLDNSQFCSAFSTQCSGECARVNSTPKHVVCQSTGVRAYSLTCYCRNKKVETQHALAAVAAQENIVTVSTLSTSTNFATATATSVIPTTILTTAFATVTSVVPVTNTVVSQTTLTLSGTATAVIGIPTIVATATPVTVTTARITQVSSLIASSTTQIVLAPTGAVQLVNTDGSQRGFVSYARANNYFYFTTDRLAATNFLAIRDPISGLYQLQLTDGTTNVFISESGLAGADVAARQDAFAWTYPGPRTLCGAAGLAAVPAAGAGSASGRPCETFVFAPGVDATTLAAGTTIALSSTWINPNGARVNNLGFTLRPSAPGLYQIANSTAFANTYGGGNIDVSLRFPA